MNRWGLGFRQSSFHHVVQVSRGGLVHVFRGPRFDGMLLSPLAFAAG